MGGSEERADPRWTAHLFFFRHSHGGTGCGSAHTITAQTSRQTRPIQRGGWVVRITTGSLDSGEGPSMSASSGCPLLYILDLITTVKGACKGRQSNNGGGYHAS